MIDISVIVLNWNGKKWLKNCYESLKTQTFKIFETILIDNASSDDSVEYTKENFPWIRILQNEKNLGYAEANNKAASVADGKYLFFLNTDTKLDENCLKELVRRCNADNGIGVYACRQLSYNGEKELNTGLACDILGYPNTGSLFYADGASLFIRRELFIRLGGFDPKHFMVSEDLDLCWRVWLLGYKVVAVPKAIVYHESGGSFVGGAQKERGYTTSIRRRYLGERNDIRNLIKNYSLKTLFWVIPLYLLINLGEIIAFLLLGKLRVVFGVYLKAYVYNIVNFPDTWRQHRKVQEMRRAGDKFILGKMQKQVNKFVGLRRTGIPKFE